MSKVYVEQRDGGYWVTGTRVSLDSLVYAFKRGASPETIKRSFPVLLLEEVYGALTFYLANQNEIENYLRESEKILEAETTTRREQLLQTKPELLKRLRKAEQELNISSQ